MAENVEDVPSDTKIAEKRPLILYGLPIHVLEKVTGQLSLVNCLALRKVSRDLRRLVDSSDAYCDIIKIYFDVANIKMELDNLKLEYRDSEDGGCIVTSNREDTQTTKTYRDARNFREAMISDASTFLNNPKLSIGRLSVYGAELEFVQFLESLNQKLNARAIQGLDLKLLDSIQEFLKPEALEEIIYEQVDFYVGNFNEASETNMEILKNPKLKFEEIVFNRYSDAISAKISAILQSLNSRLNTQTVFVHDDRWIPTILQYLNPRKVENVHIFESLEVGQFRKYATMMEWKTKTTLLWGDVPEGIGLEQFVDFKKVDFCDFNLAEENLIKIRDILLKSPHLQLLVLSNDVRDDTSTDEINERIERIMIEDPAYDSSTRRFSIPNSQDYFQLTLDEVDHEMNLTVQRIAIE